VPAEDRCPSNVMIPMRPPWRPDHTTAALLAMTLIACKLASIAILS
jgi:hypothetical protein